ESVDEVRRGFFCLRRNRNSPAPVPSDYLEMKPLALPRWVNLAEQRWVNLAERHRLARRRRLDRLPIPPDPCALVGITTEGRVLPANRVQFNRPDAGVSL